MKRTDSYLNKDYGFNFNFGGLTILGAIALIILAVIIEPFLVFWLCYFSGWIAKITIGKTLVRALELLGIIISKDQLPWLAGALGWIGSFFKNINFNNKKGN